MHRITYFTLTILCSYNVAAADNKIIGYGYSDAVLPAKNQELFYMGFEVGFDSILGKDAAKKYVQVEKVADGSQMGADTAAMKLISNKNIVALVGFPTSHEALLAARLAKENKIISLTAGSGHSALADFGPMVFSTGESMSLSVKIMIEFIKKNFEMDTGLVISNPDAVFSKNQETVIKKITTEEVRYKLNLEYASLSSTQQLSDKYINMLKTGKIKYIVLTSYPDESAKIMDQLEQTKVDLPIITNSSWNAGDIEYIRRFITKRKSPFYSATPWSKLSKAWQTFEKNVIKFYGRKSTSEMGYGYDVGVAIATVMKRVTEPRTRENMLKAFQSNVCFDNTSAGRLCFDANGGHSDRRIHMVKFTKNDFVEVEQ
ncbi:MAG: hypothetical protein A2Z20_06490 [Bdellovibrionales bacterium RBG_16_40_8]|nr:MAG: hypothetical protein A2Z20_06490 [Bdellovibrionales bacterium RBG_16_40_8]